MKRMLLLIFTCMMLSSSVLAGEPKIDEKTREVCNRVMLEIFNEIRDAKRIYPDLKLFTQFAVTKNRYGLYEIKYSYIDPRSKNKKYPLEFWVTIIGLDDENTYGTQWGTFNYPFPLLNLKIVGFQGRTPKRRQFKVEDVVKKHMELLTEHQNLYLPLQFIIKPARDEFYIDEDIEIIATLKNVSENNMLVKDLTPNSVYFLYGETAWGAKELDPDTYVPGVVLKPGESISRSFVGEGFHRSKEVKIYGSYVMTFQGVNPSSKLKVNVVR